MTDPKFTILNGISKLKLEYKDLYTYYGFAYCGFMSSKLKELMAKEGIELTLLAGKNMRDTQQGYKALKSAKDLLDNITADSSKDYLELKQFFIKNPGKLKTNLGHMVCLYKGVCYDPTSGQFNLPLYYPIQYFADIFIDLSKGKIVTGDPSINFGIDSTKFEPIDRRDLSLEQRTIMMGW